MTSKIPQDIPQMFISGQSHMRLNIHTQQFIDVLIGREIGMPADDIEANQMRLAKMLIPQADDVMALIATRLITHFVLNPTGLIEVMNIRHTEVIGMYCWYFGPGENAAQQQHHAGQGEGASTFWLSFALNDQLIAQETMLRAPYAEHMLCNRWQYLAIRAFLRLQALLIDMDQIHQISTIHSMHWAGKEVTADYAPVVPARAETAQADEPAQYGSALN